MSTDPRVRETVAHQVGRARSGPSWTYDDGPGRCGLLAPGRDRELLAEDDEEGLALVGETDPDRNVLVYVESVGPTACHDEVHVDSATLDADGALVVRASVRDPSGRLELCQAVLTYPAVLVRVTAEPAPRSVRAELADGWDQWATVRPTPGRPSLED